MRLSDGSEELADIIRAFDQAAVKVANLELHAPSLNDVFLEKTGRSLEGAQAEAAEDADTGEQPVLEGRRRERDISSAAKRAAVACSNQGARPALDPADDSAAGDDRPGHDLSADPARDQLGRARIGDQHPRLPTNSYLTFALAFAFLQAGVFAVIGTGQNLAEDQQSGFWNRMRLTPIRAPALVAGQLSGTLALGCSRRPPISPSA